MRFGKWTQLLICSVVLIVVLAAGLGFGLGIRHRHDRGNSAHSHSHPHTHSHPHSHSHPHTHSHPHEAADESSHIHLTFFGFEFTLPDFTGDKPAPLVNMDDSPRSPSATGEVVSMSAPWGQGILMRLITSWTAIRPEVVRLLPGHSFSECSGQFVPMNAGLDASPPLLPPPETA